MLFDIDGTGEREYLASAWTLIVYEQEFKASMIADVYGRVELGGGGDRVVTAEFVEARLRGALEPGERMPSGVKKLLSRAFPARVTTVIDYTTDHWEAYLRAMWAMARAADDSLPGFTDWARGLKHAEVDMRAISNFVIESCERGLFRAPAA